MRKYAQQSWHGSILRRHADNARPQCPRPAPSTRLECANGRTCGRPQGRFRSSFGLRCLFGIRDQHTDRPYSRQEPGAIATRQGAEAFGWGQSATPRPGLDARTAPSWSAGAWRPASGEALAGVPIAGCASLLTAKWAHAEVCCATSDIGTGHLYGSWPQVAGRHAGAARSTMSPSSSAIRPLPQSPSRKAVRGLRPQLSNGIRDDSRRGPRGNLLRLAKQMPNSPLADRSARRGSRLRTASL